MIDHDPGRALTAMAHAVNAGHEPRPLAEALVRHLRNGFLSLMAPELVQLSSHQVDELAAQAQRLGPAALVRAIERLGEILVELRHAPDPRVLVEVALVQLTMAPPEAADDIGAAGRPGRQARAGRRPPARRRAVAPVDPATGRTALGGRARRDPPTPRPDRPAAGAPAAARRRRRRPVDRRRRRRADARRRRPPAGRRPARRVGRAQAVAARPRPGAVHAARGRRRRRRHGHAGRAQRHPPRQVRAAPRRRRAGLDGGHRPAGHGRRGRRWRRRRSAAPAADGDRVRGRRRPARRPRRDAGRRRPGHEDIDLDDLVDAPPGTVPTTLDRLAQAFPGRRADRGRRLTWRAPTPRRSRR